MTVNLNWAKILRFEEFSRALSRFSTSEFFRARRLFPFVLELSAATKRS